MVFDEKFRNATLKYYKYNQNKSIKEIIKEITFIFEISQRTFYNWNKNIKIEKIGRPKKSYIITKKIEERIIKYYKNANSLQKIKNIIRKIKKEYNISISKSTIYNILHRNNLSYKKVSINKYPYKNNKLKKEKQRIIKETNNFKDNIISIDEFSIGTDDLTKKKKWGNKNERVNIKIAGNKSDRKVSVIQAISNKKSIKISLKSGSFLILKTMHAIILPKNNKSFFRRNKIVKGSVNGEIFKDFIMNDIISKISTTTDKKTILFMDNARIHHYKKFINEIENKNNIKIVYNIPYCPEFNPVEHIIGLIKKYIINHNIKEKSHIVKLLNTSIMQIKNKIYKNCFTNSIKKLNS